MRKLILGVALLGAVASGAPARGASAPGCVAEGTGRRACHFTITGFDVLFVQAAGVQWYVTISDPYFGTHVVAAGTDGAESAAYEPAIIGDVVSVTVQSGVVSAREL